MLESTSDPTRIVSLDQFRGYTVLGMFFVNFIGSFAFQNPAPFPASTQVIVTGIAALCKHHNTYFSYADSIMPQFFLAVGFAYRLTFLRRLRTAGSWAACGSVLRRCLGLVLLGFVIYHLDGRYEKWEDLEQPGLRGVLGKAFQRNVFQTLTHIGLASLWVLPVIAARPWVRTLYAVFSAGLFFGLSQGWYYDWVMQRPGIDGGPFGFLTWSIPLLVGTLAFDALVVDSKWRLALHYFGWAVVLMLLGYALACLNLITPPNAAPTEAGWTDWLVEPPFVPPSRPVNLWTMSQRTGSVSYLTFGAGFALAVYALFVLACDVGRFQSGASRTLGSNALAAYILHELVFAAVKPYVPKDSPLGYILAAFGVALALCYLFLRYLEKRQLFLRL